MALPVWVTWVANLKGPKGDTGDRGRPGTFDAVSAVTVPADQPAEAIISGAEGQNLELKIPRGLPGVNAVDNDAAVAAYMAAPDSATRAQLAAAVDELADKAVKPLTVLVNGDSIFNGSGASAPELAFAARLEVHLEDLLGVPVTIIQRSLGGSKSSEHLEDLKTDIQTYRPNIVLIEATVNDATPINAPTLTADNARLQIGICRAYGATPVLVTSAPIDGAYFESVGGASFNADSEALRASLSAGVRALASEQRVVLADIERAVGGTPPLQEWVDIVDAVDGVHPNDAGHDLWARTVASAIAAQADAVFLWASVASDTFARADGVLSGTATQTGGKTWLQLSGTASVQGGVAYSSAGTMRTGIDTGYNDHEVSATITPNSTALIARVIDASNYLQFSWAPNGWRLYKFVGGVSTLLAAVATDPISTGVSFPVRFRAEGRVLTGWANGEQVLTYTLTGAEFTQFASAETAGWAVYGQGYAAGTCDNFVATGPVG